MNCLVTLYRVLTDESDGFIYSIIDYSSNYVQQKLIFLLCVKMDKSFSNNSEYDENFLSDFAWWNRNSVFSICWCFISTLNLLKTVFNKISCSHYRRSAFFNFDSYLRDSTSLSSRDSHQSWFHYRSIYSKKW